MTLSGEPGSRPHHPEAVAFDDRLKRHAADRAQREVMARRCWGDLIDQARTHAVRVIDTDGTETITALDLKALAAGLAGSAFPAQGDTAQKAGAAFVVLVRALLEAALPRRRAILAPFVVAGAQALAELITEEQTRAFDSSRKQTGEEA